MPVAFGDRLARFVFVDTGGETHDELLSWGAEHAALWSALGGRGMRVEAVVVSLSDARLAESERILAGWKERGITVPGVRMSDVQLDELKRAERSLASLDEPAMSKWGGLNGTIGRVAELQRRRDAADKEGPDQIRLDGIQAFLAALEWTGR